MGKTSIFLKKVFDFSKFWEEVETYQGKPVKILRRDVRNNGTCTVELEGGVFVPPWDIQKEKVVDIGKLAFCWTMASVLPFVIFYFSAFEASFICLVLASILAPILIVGYVVSIKLVYHLLFLEMPVGAWLSGTIVVFAIIALSSFGWLLVFKLLNL